MHITPITGGYLFLYMYMSLENDHVLHFHFDLCIICNTVVGWNKYNKIQIFKKIGNMIECSLLIVSLGTNMGFNRHLKRFDFKT